MKIIFLETIQFDSPLKAEQANSIVKAGTSYTDKFNDENMLFGTVIAGKIEAKINPNWFNNAIARSEVKGTIQDKNGHARIDLEILPSWPLRALFVIWVSIQIVVVFLLDWSQFLDSIGKCLHMLFFTAILFFGLKVKVIWGRKRLEKWLKNKLGMC